MRNQQWANWLEDNPQPVHTLVKKSHNWMKAFGWTVVVVLLFCLSVGMGALSNKETRAHLPLLGKVKDGEVKGESSGGASNVTVGTSENPYQAPGNENPPPLTKEGAYYQYVEKFNGSDVTISRQPLPDNFKANPSAELQKLATNIGATIPIATGNWGTVYLMNKSDVQVAVFANTQRLVFVQSLQKHSNDEWKGFIQGLQLQ